MKINWMQKLSSRKLWLALANFIANLLIAFNVPDNEIAQIVAIVLAGGGLIAYIFTEGWVDVHREDDSKVFGKSIMFEDYYDKEFKEKE